MPSHVIFTGPRGSGKSELLNAFRSNGLRADFGQQAPTDNNIQIPSSLKVNGNDFQLTLHDGPDTLYANLQNPTIESIAAVVYCHDLQLPLDADAILAARSALKKVYPFASFALVGTHRDIIADDAPALAAFQDFAVGHEIDPYLVATNNQAPENVNLGRIGQMLKTAIMADKKMAQRTNNELLSLTGEQLVSAWQKELQATAMNPAMLNFLAQMQASTLDDAKKKALALELHGMLLVLQDNVSTVDEKTNAIAQFNNHCKGILNGSHPNWVAFGKAVGIVAASAAVLLLTVAAGFTAGLLLGLWTGPGALVSAVLGGVMAAQIAAGATAGTAVVATALTAGLMGWGLFKTPALVTAADTLVVEAENTLTPVI